MKKNHHNFSRFLSIKNPTVFADFVSQMSPRTSHGSAKLALQRFSDPANLSLDWRTVTRDLPRNSPRFEGFGALGAPYLGRFRGLPFRPGPAGFQAGDGRSGIWGTWGHLLGSSQGLSFFNVLTWRGCLDDHRKITGRNYMKLLWSLWPWSLSSIDRLSWRSFLKPGWSPLIITVYGLNYGTPNDWQD